MISWVESHGIEVLVMYYVFAAFSGGMPTPSDSASIGYRWVFSSLSILNASIARLVATQLPSSKMGQALTSGPPISPVVLAKPEAVEPSNGGK
jgi:hypothetical protein